MPAQYLTLLKEFKDPANVDKIYDLMDEYVELVEASFNAHQTVPPMPLNDAHQGQSK